MRNSFWIALAVIGMVLILALGVAYGKFQWTECRKDPDHTFWHCVQVMNS